MSDIPRAAPVQHRWFDPWLIAKGQPLREMVQSVADYVGDREQRQRARRPQDERNHRRAVDGIVCNLAYLVLNPSETGWLAINTRNGEQGKSRYENKAFGSTFRKLVELLAAGNVLERQLPTAIRGEVSSIKPTPHFANLIRRADIDFADFASDPLQEVIWLSRTIQRWSVGGGREKNRKRIDYTDTAVSCSYRSAVQKLNAFLNAADISFLADGLEPPIDPYYRTLTRRFSIFNHEEPRFDQVGRLFGGFWQSLKKERRQQIRINGEPVADLDYHSMFTRLAYAELSEMPPEGDLYAIPSLENHRDGVKLAMNCFLFDDSPNRRRWPTEMSFYSDIGDLTEPDALVPKLPAGWTVKKTKEAILQRHPALERAWGRRLGYRLMWQESEILMAVLNDLMDRNIPALGLHDGLLIPISHATIALASMRKQSRMVVGVELQCSVKE